MKKTNSLSSRDILYWAFAFFFLSVISVFLIMTSFFSDTGTTALEINVRKNTQRSWHTMYFEGHVFSSSFASSSLREVIDKFYSTGVTCGISDDLYYKLYLDFDTTTLRLKNSDRTFDVYTLTGDITNQMSALERILSNAYGQEYSCQLVKRLNPFVLLFNPAF